MDNKGSVSLSRSELLNIKVFSHIGVEAQMVGMLKEKGAPIRGCFIPEFMPGYEITTTEDLATGDTNVKWSKVNA